MLDSTLTHASFRNAFAQAGTVTIAYGPRPVVTRGLGRFLLYTFNASIEPFSSEI